MQLPPPDVLQCIRNKLDPKARCCLAACAKALLEDEDSTFGASWQRKFAMDPPLSGSMTAISKRMAWAKELPATTQVRAKTAPLCVLVQQLSIPKQHTVCVSAVTRELVHVQKYKVMPPKMLTQSSSCVHICKGLILSGETKGAQMNTAQTRNCMVLNMAQTRTCMGATARALRPVLSRTN